MNEQSAFNKQVKGGLIVSCQALEDEPLHSSFIMSKMALAAAQGGAVGIRANSAEDIAEIKKEVNLPIIGIVKRDYEGSDVFITATMKEIDELMAVEPEVIAVDATSNERPEGETLKEFVTKIKAKYPTVELMADCSTVEEAVYASDIGFDYIGTTLVGYTAQSKGQKIEVDDFKIIREILKQVDTPVIAEGNINSPEKARRVLDLGVHTVVVGSSITRPQLITEKYVNKINE
ncbi:MAG TPA: N-acetylmannosamine-6-phosphate 2-epimerase [Alloiococcus sp.]|nr:N-acetylmannosamine-6-phosphate 2-epimerase [Alloiococcus sp.]